MSVAPIVCVSIKLVVNQSCASVTKTVMLYTFDSVCVKMSISSNTFSPKTARHTTFLSKRRRRWHHAGCKTPSFPKGSFFSAEHFLLSCYNSFVWVGGNVYLFFSIFRKIQVGFVQCSCFGITATIFFL